MAERLFFIQITSPWCPSRECHLASALKRLQRLLLRLQQYDAEIRYRPGREIYLTETLLRVYQSLSPTDTQTSETKRDVESIHTVTI